MPLLIDEIVRKERFLFLKDADYSGLITIVHSALNKQLIGVLDYLLD
jgi:hypothetical protein